MPPSVVDEQQKPLLSNSKTENGRDSTSVFDDPVSATDSQRMNGYLAFLVFAAILGSFQFGWNIGVTNNSENIITRCKSSADDPSLFGLPHCLPMESSEWGAVVGVFALGGLIGGLLGGHVCKAIGRKSALLYNNILLMSGALMMSLAWNAFSFGVGRVIVGVGCGAATAAVPMYVSEIAPMKLRGTLGALHQLAIVVGVLASQIIGVPLAFVPGWRYLYAIPLIPCVLQVIFMVTAGIETPRYLISQNQVEAARQSLQRLRQTSQVDWELSMLLRAASSSSPSSSSSSSRPAVAAIDRRNETLGADAGIKIDDDELSEEYDDNATRQEPDSSLTIGQLLKSKSLRKPLMIAIAAQLSQQFSGVNGIIQYSTSIFEKFFGDNSLMITVIVGIVNLIMTIISVLLMDCAGRRVLLLTSQFGLTIICSLIVVSYIFSISMLTVVGVMLFIALFAIGLGPIPWLIIAELFPTHAVAPAASLAVMTNWISTAIVSTSFPVIAETLQDFTFLPFAIISFSLGLFMLFMLPETKGRSVEDILRRMQ